MITEERCACGAPLVISGDDWWCSDARCAYGDVLKRPPQLGLLVCLVLREAAARPARDCDLWPRGMPPPVAHGHVHHVRRERIGAMITALLAAAVGAPWFPSAIHVKPAPKKQEAAAIRPAVASWYNDAGQTASGIHYRYGFASLLFGSDWGRGVRFCYRGRCATGRLDDHGPYVAGRSFDLNAALKDALGCPDLCALEWR